MHLLYILSLFGAFAFNWTPTVSITISVVNDRLSCDGLICAVNTDTCTVSRRSNDNKTKIYNEKRCLQNNIVLNQETVEEDNPYRMTVNSYSESKVGRNGNSYQTSSNSYSSSSGGSTAFSSSGDGAGTDAFNIIDNINNLIRRRIRRSAINPFGMFY